MSTRASSFEDFANWIIGPKGTSESGSRGVLFGARVRFDSQQVPDGLNPQEHFEAGFSASHRCYEPAALPAYLERGVKRVSSQVEKLGLQRACKAIKSKRAKLLSTLQSVKQSSKHQAALKAWHLERPPSAEAVNPSFDGLLFAFLLRKLEKPLPDNSFEEALKQGFEYLGTLGAFGWWHEQDAPPCEPPPSVNVSADSFPRLAAQAASGPPDLQLPLWNATQEELKSGRLRGPFCIDCLLQEKESCASPLQHLPPGPFGITPRFAVPHNSKPAPAVRPIDNAASSGGGQNAAARAGAKVWLPSIETLVGMVRALRHVADPVSPRGKASVLAWKFDHRSAYKSWPASVEAIRAALLLVFDPSAGILKLFEQLCLCFGCLGSVYGYCFVSLAICVMCCELADILICGYVDDFLAADLADLAEDSARFFVKLHELLGIQIALEPDKADFGSVITALGQTLRCGSVDEPIQVAPTKKRAKKIHCIVAEILFQNWVRQDDVLRIAGKAQFLAGSLYGRVGRVAVRTLYAIHKRAVSPTISLLPAEREWLDFLLRVVRHGPDRVIPLERQAAKAPAEFYAWVDGEWNPTTACGGVGGLLVSQDRSFKSAFSSCIPVAVKSGWAKHSRQKQRNTQSELCAAVLLLHLYSKELQGRSLILFEDSRAAQANLVRGHARQVVNSALVRAFWALSARIQCTIWVERVASKANPADAPSRQDTSWLRSQGFEIRQCSWPQFIQNPIKSPLPHSVPPEIDRLR